MTDEGENATMARQALNTTLRNQLQHTLPSYMVPSVFLVLDAMPLTSNGKVDKESLPIPDIQDLQREKYMAPGNDAEQQLCAIWQEVLKLDKIGIHDNFFELGGDSILSIQVVSRAKREGLILTIRQLFEHPTIASIIPYISYGTSIDTPQVPVTGRQSLLPIQQRFFDLSLPEQHHFNQSILLRTPSDFSLDCLQELLISLYHRHDVLRLQFKQEDGVWRAEYQPYDNEMIANSLFYEDLSGIQDNQKAARLKASCEGLQASLNLEQGNLFRAAYFSYGKGSLGRLFLVLHHLIVDAVSLRILCSDLEIGYTNLINGKPLTLPPKSSSYQQWATALYQYANLAALQNERTYWLSKLSYSMGTIPGLVNLPTNIHNDIHESLCTLDEDQTRQLLGECNKAYRTQINELLISALFKGYCDWSDQNILRLEMEGHGREELFGTLDITETVGWFTSVYPLVITFNSDRDFGELIKSVKEEYRALPYNGIGYGVLTKLAKDTQLCSLESKRQNQTIVFNYLGTFDNLQNDNTFFRVASENTGSNISQKQSQNELISINGLVINGQLTFRFTSSSQRILPKATADFCAAFKNALKECITWCVEKNLRNNLRTLRNKINIAVETESSDEGIEI
jgi:non-ribosomal peptide synthase protein (TIGR01720 family)